MQNNREILILIDGNALLYRSFHGIPELKTKDGTLVNAVYGFANSILIAISRFRPKYLAVTFDVGKKTFRNEQYKEYKANRKETPEGLIPQFRLAREFCKALNIAIYGKPNYEADDVIGTIVKKVTVHSDITFSLGTRSHPTLTSSKTATALRMPEIARS
jgi:DNA polymerase-1